MAPRRVHKSVKLTNNNVYNNLSLNDVLCPICRSILIEPVTLPCTHGFCFSCFEGIVANTSLTCPLCRIRFSSWHRVAKKENKIRNVDLWQAIKTLFPKELENKLNGHDDYLIEELPRKLAIPGEIGKEYEAQKTKEQLEVQKQREIEAKASEKLIRKIREQEEFEEVVRKEKLLFDERLAIQLAEEINLEAQKNKSERNTNSVKECTPVDKFFYGGQNKYLMSLQHLRKSDGSDISQKTFTTRIMCQEKKLPQCFVSKVPTNCVSILKHASLSKVTAAAEVSDSNDSIENECYYFKPIDLKNIPPSKSVTVVKVPAKMYSACTVIIGAPTGKINFTHNSLSSAFVRFEMYSPILGGSHSHTPIVSIKKRKRIDDSHGSNYTKILDTTIETPIRQTTRLNCIKNSKSRKRKLFNLSRSAKRRSNRMVHMERTQETNSMEKCNFDKSPNTRNKQKILNQMYRTDININATLSPPFYGFDSGINNTQESYNTNTAANANGSINVDDALLRRKVQEENDLALAKKLQEEFNSVKYSTRSSIINKSCKKQRQITLDEIIISRSRIK